MAAARFDVDDLLGVDMTASLNRRSPLHAVHQAAGARMVPFGGWDMPLSYSTGTLAEHLACRSAAVMFDVSHLGTVRVTGSDAFAALQWALTNDLNRIGVGAAQYTHLLDEADGSVLDDIIVWWTGQDCFDVMPNASNTDRVVAALTDRTDHSEARRDPGRGGGDLAVEDVTTTRAVIAVQGPKARDLLAKISPEAAAVSRFRVDSVQIGSVPVVVAGTGYTGEDGVEIAVPSEQADVVWQMLCDAGITPAGLGARDTLRLEAGLPLYGHELGPGITPLQAGLGWVARFEKGAFRGWKALTAEKAEGPRRILRGLLGEGRRPPREGCVVRQDKSRVGRITSGNFSPVLGRGIALALLRADVAIGDEVVIDIRGRGLAAVVVKPPFHRLSVDL